LKRGCDLAEQVFDFARKVSAVEHAAARVDEAYQIAEKKRAEEIA
jgi:hypothetical protein